MTPGPDGMLSPSRTSALPSTETPVDAPIPPIGSWYGTPLTELTIVQIDPVTASGMPFATAVVWVIVVITPESGGPPAPGDTVTAHPMLTGGPDM